MVINTGANFDYGEFTTRNIGFVSKEEQETLRQSCVFVCGVGGMGGACLLSLARAGIEQFHIADLDHFEVSNLNRQVFATLDSVGHDKAESTMEALRKINPNIQVTNHGANWQGKIDEICRACRFVVNGMDDVVAGIALYRCAQRHDCTVVDAYAASLPSVFVVKPGDARPEQRLGFPTQGRDLEKLTPEDIDACKFAEISFVLTHSSTHRHVDLAIAAEMVSGSRARISFAPMVITTGNLMAYEMIKLILGKPTADDRGYFFNPMDIKVEKPLPIFVAWIKGFFVRLFLRKLLQGAAEPAVKEEPK